MKKYILVAVTSLLCAYNGTAQKQKNSLAGMNLKAKVKSLKESTNNVAEKGAKSSHILMFLTSRGIR